MNKYSENYQEKFLGIRTVGIFENKYSEKKDKIYSDEIPEKLSKTMINNRQVQKITWYKNNNGKRGRYIATTK